MRFLNNKSILITGGTGSLGKALVHRIVISCKPKKLVILSRDEQKQYIMSQEFSENKFSFLRYFIGDVRSKDRMRKALSGIDLVIHTAAMKIVSTAEYNPSECIETNINGAQNIIDAAIFNKVSKVLALSTDKAANPLNLYGATKLCSDKLFIAANNLSGNAKTRFSVIRYGNVLCSRGSVVPIFKNILNNGNYILPITDKRMTRFLITIDQGVDIVLKGLKNMIGGEIIVPKLPSFKITELVQALSNKAKVKIIGIRAGEKLHEVLIPEEESINCIDMGEYFLIQPMFSWWNTSKLKKNIGKKGKIVEKLFQYSSDKNKNWLSVKELKKLIERYS